MRTLAAVAAILCALAGCARAATPDPTPSDAPADSGSSLTGTEWQLVEMTVGGLTTQVPPSIDAVLRFDGAGSYSARACNYTGGSAEIDDDSLVLGLGSMTAMACRHMGADIDQVLGGLADESVRWAIAGEELTLAAPDGPR